MTFFYLTFVLMIVLKITKFIFLIFSEGILGKYYSDMCLERV